MQVTLIDQELHPGGVCLYRGCIPSKALLHVAKVLEAARQATHWGVTFAAPTIDVEKLRTWKEGVVQKLTGGLGDLCKRRGVTFVQGRATFLDATTLLIRTTPGEEQRLTFAHAIVATGYRHDGVTKLILDPPTSRILGVGIAGSGAGELIAEGVLAVEMAALASDLALSIHPHPTLSETLMEAAEVFFGQSTHIYRPQKRRHD